MQHNNETLKEASTTKRSKCNTSRGHQTKGKQLSTKDLNHNNHQTSQLTLVIG
jgi:hypothetical protein